MVFNRELFLYLLVVGATSTGLVFSTPIKEHDLFERYANLNNKTQDIFEKRALSEFRCSGLELNAVQVGVQDAIAMSAAINSKTSQLFNYLNQNPVPRSSTLGPQAQAILQTFEAYFGQVYFGPSNPAANAKGSSYVQAIRDRSAILLDGLQSINSLNLQFFCDDLWAQDTDPDGDVSTEPGLVFWDGRPGVTDPTWTSLRMNCRTSSVYGFCFDDNVNPSSITLCPTYFPNWISHVQNGDTFISSQNTVFPKNTPIDSFNGLIIGRAIFHESSHSSAIMGSQSNIFLDSTCQSGQYAYDFQCVHSLALSNSDGAVRNADSFTLFGIAMLLGQNNWYTGYPQPI